MALETISKETLNFYVPRFEIEINDQKLPSALAKAIIDVLVDEKIDVGASFTLTLNDEVDMTTQEFKWLDHELLDVGNDVTIKMGYGNTLHTILMGNIKNIEPSFFSGEVPTITISGQDLSFDYLKRSSPARSFDETSYSEVAKKLAEEAGLEFVGDEAPTQQSPIRKDNNEKYFRFLQSCAEQIGFEFFVDRKKMHFITPRDDQTEILTLELGKDLISFRPRLNTTQLVSEVEVRGHNPRDPATPLIGRATTGSERTQESGRTPGSRVVEDRHRTEREVISGIVVESVEHANAIALSKLNRAADTLIVGDGACVGIPQIRPSATIKLEKMGRTFSGKYYVKGTTHTINSSGYRTQFSVKRNAK